MFLLLEFAFVVFVCFPESHPQGHLHCHMVLTSFLLVSSPSLSCPAVSSGAPWWKCQHLHISSPVTLLMVCLSVTHSVHTCHFLAHSPLLPSFLFWCLWAYHGETRWYPNQALGCLPTLSITMQWLVFSSCNMMTLLLFISYCELCIKDVSGSILHDYSLVHFGNETTNCI